MCVCGNTGMIKYYDGKLDAVVERPCKRCQQKEEVAAMLELSTPEKVALIGSLSDKLKWLHGYGGGRAEHVQTALRLVEICKLLPEGGDAA